MPLPSPEPTPPQALSSDLKVSVVIPCYNAADVVGRAVESALNQTLRPTRIICVDDGSSDETWQVLQSLEERGEGIVLALTGPNAGAPAARNRGLAEATGEYVQFLDADDSIDPSKLERHVRLASESGADLVAGASRWLRLDGSVSTKELGGPNPWLALINRRLGITSANLWRRATVHDVGGWNEEWDSSQETELMARMLRHGAKVVYDHTPGATIYEREGSISHSADVASLERHVRLRVSVLEHLLREKTLQPKEVDQATDTVFSLIRRLSVHNLSLAQSFHDRVIPATYVPPARADTPITYVGLYRTLGFRGAETVRAYVRRIRSALSTS